MNTPDAGRATCDRCRRPLRVCYCAHLPTLAPRTRVVLLQHPRERRMGVGTARMAHLALAGSTLRVGVDFTGDEAVEEMLAHPEDTYVLFPGATAIDVASLPRDRPTTIVVLDGTWWHAKKLLRTNPRLAALPRVAFRPTRPSDYRIRQQPAAHCVSTIEALAEVLTVLEPAGDAFEQLREPFRAMVEEQVRFETEVQAHRHARRRSVRVRRATLGERLSAMWPRLVCIQGEANAWPARAPEREPPELVHFVAHRVASGETLECVVAPRRRLAPSTPHHIAVDSDTLLAGMPLTELRSRVAAFVRPDDVVVTWGTFYLNLALEEAIPLPNEALDLRACASSDAHARIGTLEGLLERLGVPTPAPLGLGRGGRRLAAIAAALRTYRRSSTDS